MGVYPVIKWQIGVYPVIKWHLSVPFFFFFFFFDQAQAAKPLTRVDSIKKSESKQRWYIPPHFLENSMKSQPCTLVLTGNFGNFQISPNFFLLIIKKNYTHINYN